MVSLSIDVASSTSKANGQARASKSDQVSAGDGFGALVDSNVADATAAAPAEAAPLRSQPAPRSESSSNTGDSKDQPPQKPGAASDNSNEPVAAQTDAAVAIDAAIETPVVTITLEGIANIAVGIVPVEDAAPAADTFTDADASTIAEAAAIQPVVTGIVAPVAAGPVIGAATAIDAAPVASADAITVDAAATATTPAIETEANATPAPARVAATEQAAEPAAIITGAAVAAATKPKPAAAAQAENETKTDTDGITASVETKAQASAALPTLEAMPAAKPDATEKPVAEAEAKTETAVQPDAATPARGPRPAHAAATEARLDPAPTTNTSNAPTTSPVQHTPTPQPQTTANANVVPPPINASVQLASNIAVPVSGLAVNIAFNANAGRSRFEIRLDPAELGRIDVRLDVDRNGHVTSHLTVERPATLDMLRRDAPQLQRALEDAGLKTGDSSLQFSLRDQSQQQAGSDDRFSRGQPYRLVVDETQALPAEANRTYARLAAARGGIDIRI